MRALPIGIVAVVLACTTLAGAQTLADIDKAQGALNAAWEKTPISVRRVLFVTERPKIYGAYQERPSATFKVGEVLLTYIEPVGFSWTPGPDGFGFGVVVDFKVKQRDGKILGGQERFLTLNQASRNRVHELMINIDLTLTGAPAGDYVLEYTLHDTGNGKTTSTEQPFSLVN